MWLFLLEALIVALVPLDSEQAVTTENNPNGRRVQPERVQARLQNFFEDFYTTDSTLPPPTTWETTTTVKTRPPTPVVEAVTRPPLLSRMTFAAPKRTSDTAPRANMLDMMRSTTAGLLKPLPQVRPLIFFPSDPTNPPSGRESGNGNNGNGNAGTTMIFAPNTPPPPTPRAPGNTASTTKPQTCQDFEGLYNNTCYELLKQGPCASDEWLIEKDGNVQCAQGKCRYPELPFEGKCAHLALLVTPNYLNCSEGMAATPSRDGSVQCECNPGNIYDPIRGACFAPYRQGPCNVGQYFAPTGTPDTPSAACVRNPCSGRRPFHTEKVCYGTTCPRLTRESSCVELNALCNGDGQSRIGVSILTLKVGCYDPNSDHLKIRNIGNVPMFACGRGTKRDVQGKCRPTNSPNFS